MQGCAWQIPLFYETSVLFRDTEIVIRLFCLKTILLQMGIYESIAEMQNTQSGPYGTVAQGALETEVCSSHFVFGEVYSLQCFWTFSQHFRAPYLPLGVWDSSLTTSSCSPRRRQGPSLHFKRSNSALPIIYGHVSSQMSKVSPKNLNLPSKGLNISK